jgi:NAD(P)-dependent dehydrogenase (short-subunit alcohol dehydrogenase family)
MRLKNLAAVVTGGGSGIGRAIAREFATEGAGVAVFGRDPVALEAAINECGSNALAVPGDVRSIADLERLFRDAHAHFGRLDVVVANAGIALARPFEAVDEHTFDGVSETNFKGTFFTVQKAAPYLRQGGSVILVSSALGHLGVADLAVYAATKAAIRSLGRTLCAALLPKGVRVNVLSPGPVATPIFDKMGLPPVVLDNRDALLLADVAMKRFADPKEIARAAVFLASSDSSFMAGAELMADGGHAQI